MQYLKYFTWLDRAAIDDLARTVAEAPAARAAQRHLAREVTTMVHGLEELGKAERASQILFGGSIKDASVEDLLLVFEDVPSTTMSAAALTGLTMAAAAHAAGLAASRGEAGRLIKQGGVYVNGERVTDDRRLLTTADTIGGRLIVFQKGQRERRLVRVEGP